MVHQISRIKYFNVNGPLKILNFGKIIPVNMLITLWNKFGLNKRDIDDFVSDNKNLGVFLYLSKKDISFSDNWKQFIDMIFKINKLIKEHNNKNFEYQIISR